MKSLFLSILSFIFYSCSSTASKQELKTVKNVDLNKYLGTWYEIVRLPAWFEKDCFGVSATYELRNDGKIKVLNKCFKNSLNGKVKEAVGKAWIVDKFTNAKLKVTFFWPFAGNYWIIDLDDKNYEYAVVGEPNRKYFWVLSRSKIIEDNLLNNLLAKAKQQGYNLDQLIKTVH